MGNFLWDLRGVPTAGSFRLGWLPDVNQAPGSNTRSEQARSGIFADRTYVRKSVIRQKTDFPRIHQIRHDRTDVRDLVYKKNPARTHSNILVC